MGSTSENPSAPESCQIPTSSSSGPRPGTPSPTTGTSTSVRSSSSPLTTKHKREQHHHHQQQQRLPGRDNKTATAEGCDFSHSRINTVRDYMQKVLSSALKPCCHHLKPFFATSSCL